ncbi:hypothetical protein PHMEG_00019089 [Phytophthora megakarya]|uniref:Uncharacterized protein n=1 Tax=Phytophthora megakarya TaxID=4795 RepID=A0A225VS61_9STRA|nr:hypothetical protein PHMEG_00019089 [Phytophthora megakarya]
MDEFGVYLAVHTGAKGQSLSRHSATQYFCQVKCWILDENPGQGGAVELQMFSLGRTHKQHCIICVHEGESQEDDELSIFIDNLRIRLPRCRAVVPSLISLWTCNGSNILKSKGVLCELTESIPLLDLLDDGSTLDSSQVSSTNCSTSAKPVAEIHALVNRLIDRVAGPAGVEDALTSHSFRRGGAQHANASSEPTAQWIFDRGIWNMTTANKAFVTQEQVREVSYKLFNASHGFANKAFNFSKCGIDVQTAIIIYHYPWLMEFNSEAPAKKTIQRCDEVSGMTTTSLAVSSQQLARRYMGENAKAKVVFDHQSALSGRLIKVNRNLEVRVSLLKSTNIYAAGKTSAREDQEKRPMHNDESVPVKSRRQKRRRHLWASGSRGIRQFAVDSSVRTKHKKSDSKQLVAFVWLFIDEGYALDDSSPTYTDNVRQVGGLALQEVTAFKVWSNAVLWALSQLYHKGILNDLTFAYQ